MLWRVKSAGLVLGFAAFFAVYFWVLNHPVFPVMIMPATVVDRYVGIQDWALPLYLSLWVYVPLAFLLPTHAAELWSCGREAVALGTVGLGLFFLWPTAVPASDVDWSAHPALVFLKAADASGNACPSLHVAFAVFAAVRLGPLLREMGVGPVGRTGNWLWCLAIIYSTLATGQHVALDALAGAALGALVAGARRFRTSPVAGQRASCAAVGTTQR